jgi:DNA topoisomerase IA
MQWLILTESNEKAKAFRSALPGVVCISTRGNPWEPTVAIENNRCSYQKKIKESHLPVIQKIEEESLSEDKILLAFEPTTTGEAIATEFETLLGIKKCIRWGAQNLQQKEIRRTIHHFETLLEKDVPKADRGMASSYWCQAVMDIVWTARVSKWLREHFKREERVTRLLGGMLKVVAEEERRMNLHRQHRYWEISMTLKPAGEQHSIEGYVIVPTFAMLTSPEGAPSKTKEIWRRKLDESKKESLEGYGVPQPDPGKPWRYSNWEEAEIQRRHLQKFPYLVLDIAQQHSEERGAKPPLTNASLSQLALKTSQGTHEEVQSALTELYHEGWITYPKTTNPNLWKKTFVELRSSLGPSLKFVASPRIFQEEQTGGRPEHYEALRPTQWEQTAESLETLLPPSQNKAIKVWAYRMIHNRAISSQLDRGKTTSKKFYLTGPLFLTKSGVRERQGKPFRLTRENNLQAHMNIIVGAETPCGEQEPSSQEAGAVYECTSVSVNERRSRGPRILSEEELFEKMSGEGLGKRQTLKELVNQLRRLKLMETTNISLTTQGKSLAYLLNQNFGQFLDHNYHRTISENLRQIEQGVLEPEEFLYDWWVCLRTFLEEHETSEPTSTHAPQKKTGMTAN